MSKLFLDENYKGVDYTTTGFPTGEYDNCTFTECLFPKLHLSNTTFLECTFTDCNFTNAKFGGTTLNDVVFKGCKMVGVDLSVCNDFMLSIQLDGCVLDLANCYQLRLTQTHFKDCSLKETDFTECNLSQAIFTDCNLKGALFDRTDLQKTDFRTAQNYTIDLDLNKVKGAQFSKEGVHGLLIKYGVKVS
jgi:uncharacterized protein YjbI with pentapeptide repeats